MAYRWSLEGPAFEFPSPYGTENRFLVLRGYALIAIAVLIGIVVTFVTGEDPEAAVVIVEQLPEKASAVPHLLAAMLLSLLGARDLWKASTQRSLLLAPGQPTSLLGEVPREGVGVSAGAETLQHLLQIGEFKQTPPAGDYAAALRELGEDIGAAPATLHAYLRVRLSHLMLVLGLGTVLLVALLALRSPVAQGLAALVPLGLCTAVLALRALQPERPALRPWMVLALVLLAAAGAAAMGLRGEALPRAASVPRLGLPLAVAVMLGSVLLFELLGLLAGRAQLQAPQLSGIAPEEVTIEFDAHPETLMREVDLELHRQWTEGIPNRRYGWVPPQLAEGADYGAFEALVLEESQPLVPSGGRKAAAPPLQSAERRRGLLAIDVAGLCWSLAGGLLWVWLAWAHMRDATASWVPAASGIVALAVGGYALRVAHLLWSRVEVVSIISWLEFRGDYLRAQLPSAEPARPRGESAVRVDGLQWRARVAALRSMFYAAAPHGPGSRVMLEMVAHRTIVRQDAAPEAAPGPRRPARFCAHCGTPLLVGARFCQHCGATVAAD